MEGGRAEGGALGTGHSPAPSWLSVPLSRKGRPRLGPHYSMYSTGVCPRSLGFSWGICEKGCFSSPP